MLKPTPSKPGLFSVAFKRFSCLRGIAVVAFVSLVFAVTYLVSATPQVAYATTASTLNFQARLESSSGAIAPDGTYNVEFKLYNVSSGGSAEWTEDYLVSATQGVKVANGYLTVNLGSINAFSNASPAINWGQPLYLTMNIGNLTSCSPFSTCSPDGEMSPRLPLTSVPSAFSLQSPNSGSFTSTLSFVQPTASESILLPAESGSTETVCYQNDTNCGFAPTTLGTGYIQNGTSQQTSANFNIAGEGQLATLDATGSGTGNTLTIGSTAVSSTGGVINVGTSDVAGTINVGGTTQTGQITIGQSTASNSISIGAAALGTGVTQTINIGTDAGGTTGTADNVTIGSAAASSGVTINGGFGVNITGGLGINLVTNGLGNIVLSSGNAGVNLNTNTGNGSPTNINTVGTGVVSIGNASDTGGVNILADAASQFVTSAGALTLNSAASASWTVSDANALTLGPGGAGTVNLQAGASGGLINIGNNAVNYSTGNGIQIGQSNSANTASINIGTNSNATGTQTITIGTSASAGSSVAIKSGSTSGVNINASINSPTNINSGTSTGTVTIGNASDTGGVKINADAASQFVTSAGALTLTSGASATWSTSAGSLAITGATTLALNSTGANAVTLDSGTTGTVNIGISANSKTIQIGATNSAITDTIAIGNNTNASGISTVTIGSTKSTSATTINAGSGNITLNGFTTINQAGNPLALNNTATLGTVAAEDGILFQSAGVNDGEIGIAGDAGNIITQSANNDLALKSISGNILFAAGSTGVDLTLATNGNLTLNDGLLVLLNVSTASAPTEVNGGIYYNTTNSDMYCGTLGAWQPCAGVLGSLPQVSNNLGSDNIGSGVPASNQFTYSVSNTPAGYTPPVNDCTPGAVYLISAAGYWNQGTGSARGFVVTLYDGTTTVDGNGVFSPAGTTLAADTTQGNPFGWNYNATITCVSTTTVTYTQMLSVGLSSAQGTFTNEANETSTTLQTWSNSGASQIHLDADWIDAPTGASLVMTQFYIQRLAP